MASTAPRQFSSTTCLPATQYLLRYEYIPDVLEKRGPYREGHLALAKEMITEGKCLSGGPTGEVGMEVPTGALFIFTDAEAAKEYVSKDPYVSGGIVTGHSIEEWTIVLKKEVWPKNYFKLHLCLCWTMCLLAQANKHINITAVVINNMALDVLKSVDEPIWTEYLYWLA